MFWSGKNNAGFVININPSRRGYRTPSEVLLVKHLIAILMRHNRKVKLGIGPLEEVAEIG
jgi:hypothetical protein